MSNRVIYVKTLKQYNYLKQKYRKAIVVWENCGECMVLLHMVLDCIVKNDWYVFVIPVDLDEDLADYLYEGMHFFPYLIVNGREIHMDNLIEYKNFICSTK